MTLADYDPTQQPKKPAAPTGGNLADAFGASSGGLRGIQADPGMRVQSAAAPAPAPAPAPASLPPAAAPASNGLIAGWEDFGNNLVRNSATGQIVDRNHPVYLQSGPLPAASGGGGAAPAGAGGPITTAQGVTGSTATVGGQTAQGAPTTVAQSFQQALVNRLNPGAVNAQNPAISGAIEANKLAEQRGMERNRNLLAERAAKSGTDASGGFDTTLLGLSQDRAAREGAFAGNAVSDLARQQQQDLTAALAMGGNLLSDQDRMGLQERLAQLDAQLRREGLGAQTSLGNRDIDLRGELGRGQLNLGLLSALLQNQQFGRGLDQNASQFTAGLDQAGILALLGGL